ncbi:hypothetical protein GCM10010174_35370 [Kutzneria viridogrisea]|uniref:Uncharacterized protein n=1 Tax=Kutzneria viridogrisea TaxID=47990 RepID=A0ABR6BLG1_9PSEU|nr:hypothetical protein [Kutzneria viridogrisea]
MRQRKKLGQAFTVTGVAVALLAGGSPGAQAAPTSPAATGPQEHALTLVTGDHVLVREVGGKQVASVAPRAGSSDGFVTQQIGGDLYVIPATALPYLGRSLDRSLFDVSALIRDGLTQPPIKVTGGTAPAPGPEFGAALARQAGADAARHFTGDGLLFGGVSKVALDAPGEPQPATPNFPMNTVKIAAVDQAGKPTSASLGVINVDDSRQFGGFPSAVNGEARISVPAGNYSLVAVFPEIDPNGKVTALRLVTSDFSITGDTSVAVDARKATSKITVDTPRPSTQTSITLGYQRLDARKSGSLGLGYGGGTAQTYVAPSTPSQFGESHFNLQTHSESPAGTADPYSYDLKLDNAGAIAANQHYRVTADQLATVKAAYYSDKPARQEGLSRIMFLPYEQFGFGVFEHLTAPLRRTEYVGGSADLLYAEALLSNYATFTGIASGDRTRYQPRSSTPVDWLRGPLAPGLVSPADPTGPWVCSACRKDDTLLLALAPVVDSAGHSMYLDAPGADTVSTSRFQLLSGDKTVADLKDVTGGQIAVPAEQANYKIVYDQTRTAPWFHQSTVSHSEWTFGSAHSGSTGVPANWRCGADGKPDHCSALPLVTANYQLDAGLDGTKAAGPDQVVVTFGHAPGTQNLPIARASIEVSFDGGAHWTPTYFADLGNGRFRAQWTNPASATGGDVALRVSATDAGGNTLTQSVTGALTVPAA